MVGGGCTNSLTDRSRFPTAFPCARVPVGPGVGPGPRLPGPSWSVPEAQAQLHSESPGHRDRRGMEQNGFPGCSWSVPEVRDQLQGKSRGPTLTGGEWSRMGPRAPRPLRVRARGQAQLQDESRGPPLTGGAECGPGLRRPLLVLARGPGQLRGADRDRVGRVLSSRSVLARGRFRMARERSSRPSATRVG